MEQFKMDCETSFSHHNGLLQKIGESNKSGNFTEDELRTVQSIQDSFRSDILGIVDKSKTRIPFEDYTAITSNYFSLFADSMFDIFYKSR